MGHKVRLRRTHKEAQCAQRRGRRVPSYHTAIRLLRERKEHSALPSAMTRRTREVINFPNCFFCQLPIARCLFRSGIQSQPEADSQRSTMRTKKRKKGAFLSYRNFPTAREKSAQRIAFGNDPSNTRGHQFSELFLLPIDYCPLPIPKRYPKSA